MSVQPPCKGVRDLALVLAFMALSCQAREGRPTDDDSVTEDASVARSVDARPAGSSGGGDDGGSVQLRDSAAPMDGPDAKDSGLADGGGPQDAGPARLDTGMAQAPGCRGAALCEDFEAAAEGPYSSPQFALAGGRSAHYSVTSEQKRSGQRSIKVQTDGAQGSAAARRMLQATVGDKLGDGKSVFSRVWMYFPQLPRVSRGGKDPHYRLVRSTETIAPKVDAIVSAGIVGKDRGRMLYFKLVGFKDCAADGAVLPAGKWTCVELRSDPAGYQSWIDGQPIGMRSTVSGDQCWQRRERVATVGFGFEMAAGEVDAPLTFYMDDLALSDKRIGCD